MHKKMKMTLQRAENLVHAQQHYGVSFYKRYSLSKNHIADMAILMSDFDNFDIDQMSSNFAQRQYFVYNFHCKKNSFVSSLEDAKNAILHFFIVHPIFEIGIFFFHKRNTIMLLPYNQVFSSLQGHLHFFVYFFFTFMGQFFLGHPIPLPNLCFLLSLFSC